jgi:hypothetical protein
MPTASLPWLGHPPPWPLQGLWVQFRGTEPINPPQVGHPPSPILTIPPRTCGRFGGGLRAPHTGLLFADMWTRPPPRARAIADISIPPRARAGSTATAINGHKTVKIHVCESTVLSPLYPVEVCTLPLRCRVESGGVPPSQGHGPPRGAVHIRPATAQQSHVPSLPLVGSGLKRSFIQAVPRPVTQSGPHP